MNNRTALFSVMFHLLIVTWPHTVLSETWVRSLLTTFLSCVLFRWNFDIRKNYSSRGYFWRLWGASTLYRILYLQIFVNILLLTPVFWVQRRRMNKRIQRTLWCRNLSRRRKRKRRKRTNKRYAVDWHLFYSFIIDFIEFLLRERSPWLLQKLEGSIDDKAIRPKKKLKL